MNIKIAGRYNKIRSWLESHEQGFGIMFFFVLVVSIIEFIFTFNRQWRIRWK